MSYYVRESGISLAQTFQSMVVNLTIYEVKEAMCKEEKEELKKEIDRLKSGPIMSDPGHFRGLSTTYLTIPEVRVKNPYVQYIRTYGVPEDGYFISELLADFS